MTNYRNEIVYIYKMTFFPQVIKYKTCLKIEMISLNYLIHLQISQRGVDEALS